VGAAAPGRRPRGRPAVGLRFHRGDAIPRSLRGLPEGVSEVDVDGVGLHVLSGVDAAGPYAVVDHESDYEKVELVVYSMFTVFFLGFLLLAAALGSFVARRIVNPISELAVAVARGRSPLPLQDRKDELGILARALEAHTTELRAFLDRERFFTGDVSHELRSPLTVIMGAAEILMTNSTDEATRRAGRTHLPRRARGGRMHHRPAVAGALARARQLAGRAGRCHCRARSGTLPALVDGKHVTLDYQGGPGFAVQVPAELCAAAIGNLVRNACQYTEEGSITVALSSGRVVVEDTGPGLPAAVRETLACSGAMAGAIPSRGSNGTGLGLSLVLRICEYLGASLGYEERLAGGSRFTIDFGVDFTHS
jgi:signal transduction histidine kinase